jgi:hypothetical protein
MGYPSLLLQAYELNYVEAPPTRLLTMSLIRDSSRNHYVHEDSWYGNGWHNENDDKNDTMNVYSNTATF